LVRAKKVHMSKMSSHVRQKVETSQFELKV